MLALSGTPFTPALIFIVAADPAVPPDQFNPLGGPDDEVPRPSFSARPVARRHG